MTAAAAAGGSAAAATGAGAAAATEPRSYRYGPTALMTIPNAITITRLGITPILLVIMVRAPISWFTFTFGFLLAMSDILDGYLARRLGKTRSGAFLDPLADKILFIGAMGALVLAGRLWWVPVAVIAAREVWMCAFRSWLSKRGVSIPATRLAKIKTNAQGLAVGFALLPLTAHHLVVAYTLLWTAVVLTIVTGVQYAVAGWRLTHASRAARAG